MAKQILFIHGGMTFKKRENYLNYLKTREISLEKRNSWSKEYLDNELSDFQIIRPSMPLKDNSNYEDWKIHFERYFEFIDDDVILIGNSLGGIFLAKYLSENKFPKKIKLTILVCAPFDDSIPEEDLAGGFELSDSLDLLEENSPNLKLFFSEDDEIVPLSQAEKYSQKLKKAEIIICKNKNGHFFVEEFPELVNAIKEL